MDGAVNTLRFSRHSASKVKEGIHTVETSKCSNVVHKVNVLAYK